MVQDVVAIGRLIQRARTARGLTQRAVAATVQTSRTTIALLEQGRRLCRSELLDAICRLVLRKAPSSYFVFESDVKAVPDQPTRCQGCDGELEPLRRWGGLCRACVQKRSVPPPPPTDALRSRLTVVRTVYRYRSRRRERFVEVRCECGRTSVLKLSTWRTRRPASCNKCRLRAIAKRGFEAEHGR